MARLPSAFGKEVQSYANLAHNLHIGERSTILHKSCAYIALWEKKYILHIYCALGREPWANVAH